MREPARLAAALATLGLALAVVASSAPALEIRPRGEPLTDDERLAPDAMEPDQRLPLRDGTLVGEIELRAPWSDFRGQAIPSGEYALRYALQPRLKDHSGADAVRDFALLVPRDAAAAEGKGGASAWIAASRRVSGTAHPAVLALIPWSGPGPPPTPWREDGGRIVEYLDVGGLVLGFVVAGRAETHDAL